MRWNFHRADYAVAKREGLEIEVENILGKDFEEKTMMSSDVSYRRNVVKMSSEWERVILWKEWMG
jgi:hypothetical protein